MLKIKIGDTWAETNGLEIPVVLRSPVFSEHPSHEIEVCFAF